MVKKKIGTTLAIIVFALFSIGLMYMLVLGGHYPSGSDTMCHIYKGEALYTSILKGNWYPLYDQFWYNGVQMMRYWAPFPVYVLAGCDAIVQGDPLNGYIVFVGLVFFLGALSWLFIGYKNNRLLLGSVMGVLWFFMPNNLFALFVEGNLPRSLSMVFLPLFFFFLYEYLYEDRWQYIKLIIPVFTLILLCHTGYAGMIALAVLLYLAVFRMVMKQKGKCIPVIVSMLLPFLLIGIWLIPSLLGGITSTDSSQVMKGFFQKAWISLNPIRRITEGNVDFYFGMAAFLVAILGTICSKKKAIVGFATGILIFICTTTAMYPVLNKLPGSQYLWMLRFISIALCMILMSIMYWSTLKRWILLMCMALLIVDTIPSLSLIYSGQTGMTAKENLNEMSQTTLIAKARAITTQRIALLDGSSLGATAQYMLTGIKEDKVQQTFGAGWQSAATASDIVLLNEAVEQGYYYYLFDRTLEMGDDTVLIRISELKYEEKDIEEVTEAATKSGYQLVVSNSGYLLYHIDTYKTFGSICQYNGIGIGSSALWMSLTDPDIEKGDSDNLNDYSYQTLSQYKVIYLAGFVYQDKDEAEKLLIRLAKSGVRIIVNGDGIPNNKKSRNQEFLGVTCHSIKFQNGYPILYRGAERGIDTYLFEREHRDWNTVYFTGLTNTTGYIYDNGVKVDFLGTAQDSNITFVGLNLTYHYALTKDENVGSIIHEISNNLLRELPDRKLVPLSISYKNNQISIQSDYDQVNTSIAYHDIFQSDKKVWSVRNLIYLNQGKVTITMHYPYLGKGILLSIMGVLLTIFFCTWLQYQQSARKRSEEE